MIRTEKEYQDMLRRLEQDKEVMKEQRSRLEKLGLKDSEVNSAMEPVVSFHLQLQEEVEWYKQAKNGKFQPVYNLEQIGSLLIGLRISSGITQKEFATLLGVSEAQVSRDEKNEYHGITVERAQKILETLKTVIEINVKKSDKPRVSA